MDESSLISKLESSHATGIHAIFSDHLSPFSQLTNPEKSKRSAKNKADEDRQTLARSLAKRFLPLLNRALGALPKRLDEILKLRAGNGDGLAQELFETFRLCLDCLESVAGQLSGKPYTVQFQRLRMVRCFEVWEQWSEAEAECFVVLEKLKELSSGPNSWKCRESLLPDTGKGGGDEELGRLVADIVARLARCVGARASKNGDDYRRILRLVEESRPWFRVLDENTHEKLHRGLVTYLGKCATLLVGEQTVLDEDLAHAFCSTTMSELCKSPAKDAVYKVARKICLALFPLQSSRSAFTINMLICVFDCLLLEGKVERENNEIEFVELIAYCSNKCKANPDFCSTVGHHLNKIVVSQVKMPFYWILRLYATGLLVVNYKIMSKCNNISSLDGLIRTLPALLSSLRGYFHKDLETNRSSCSADVEIAYLNALKFICLPLAEVVSLEKKQIISGSEAAAISVGLSPMQEAFYQFFDAFFLFKRCRSISEVEKEGFDETNILSIAVASFVVSLGTKLNMEKSLNLLKDVIISEWIQPSTLKHLYSSLYNVGVTLYKDERLKEALEALKLASKASWTCVLRLCDMFLHKIDGSSGDLSEDAIVNFVDESCTRNACLLSSIHQQDSHEVKKLLTESLENWSVVANQFSKLSLPMSFVKQWVKMECCNHKNVDVQNTTLTLYNVLSPSGKVSKRIIGIIMEQELHAYAEANTLHPQLCEKMQMKVIGYLLTDVYVTPESCLQRSRVLVQKGRVLSFYGHCLKDRIDCISDAISAIEIKYGETGHYDAQTSHQLAVAYSLRAFCVQEAEPDSKQVFQDIRKAIKFWLNYTAPNSLSAKKNCFIVPENTMILLYNITDLLSLKGCMDIQYDVCRIMLRLFERRKMPLEKSLAVLWECQRLRHALCISPVNEAILKSFADSGVNSIDFWMSCLKRSKAGFEHNFSFLFANFPGDSYHGASFTLNFTVEEFKKVASQLVSETPTSTSVFVAGHLLYELSERLILNGCIKEALTCAKEALRLRATLFKEKFKFNVEQQQPGNPNYIMDAAQKLQVRRSVANDIWLIDTISFDLESCYLSPWVILQCYLESTLQVGVACELIGDGAEAEGVLLWGKSISCLQNLPIFMVSFSSVLGKLYCKKRLWDLAEKELHSAKNSLEISSGGISCSKCKLILEVTVDELLGDLALSIHEGFTKTPSSFKCSSNAGSMYQSALDKLNHPEWESSSSRPEVACVTSYFAGTEENQQCVKKPPRKENKGTKEVKKTRNQNPAPQKSLRTTRSKSRTSEAKSVTSDSNACSAVTNGQTELKNFNGDFETENVFICKKMRCWHCLQIEVMENGLLNNLIDMKWEFYRRKLLLRSLIGLGKYLECCGRVHEAHKNFLQCILVLVNQDLFHLTASSIPEVLLLDMIGKEVLNDMFIVERVELLYNLSWISLKHHHSRVTRVACCSLSQIQPPQLVAWLMQVFVSCCEVPILFQKVSRLLAIIFLLPDSYEIGSLSSSCKAVSETQWASFFHQASIGTHLNYQFYTNNDCMSKVKDLSDAKGSYVTGSISMAAEQAIPRLAPKSVEDLEAFVHEFFVGFPCPTATCISLLAGSYADFLQEILHFDSSIHAWMLISRFDCKSQPIVLLLPLESILEESLDDGGDSYYSEIMNLDKHWKCPWGSTVVDDVAPAFRLLLEENFISSASFPTEDTMEERKLWWRRRKRLDYRLEKFLRDLEDLWLGPWKYVLLGPLSDFKTLDSMLKKLARSLKSKCKMDVNESLLRVMLGAPKDAFKEEVMLSLLCLKKSCYIGVTKWREKDVNDPDSSAINDKMSSQALQLVNEAVTELAGEDCIDREPMMLVLEFDVQMLPWENVPILRNQEVYRMPSVWSISAVLNRSFYNQEQSPTFPFIDPLDAFYLLNPGGDLSDTQIEFEKWFKDQTLEGTAGSAPTSEELAVALKNHDLFLYFGHGSGAQYISSSEIQKLENCAATLLMGCSSGSLTLNGGYAPKGAPLSYLLASSPVIVANLWEVTDKDIDRFAKSLLQAWFKERVTTCSACATLAEELEALTLKGRKGNTKKKVPTQKKSGESVANCCNHRPKIGSFIAQARDACTLPFLIGAAPVCYGVPTGIRNKKNFD